MLEIQTSTLSTRKRVLIDGTEYVVRRLGAGDELAISQILRRTEALIKKAEASGKLTEKEEQEFVQMQERSLGIYANTFDDGGDGTKAMELVSSLSYNERALLYEQIFGVKKEAGDDEARSPDSES